MIYEFAQYQSLIERPDLAPDPLYLGDHLGGFDQNLHNPILHALDRDADFARKSRVVLWQGYLDPRIHRLYPNLRLQYFMPDHKQWYVYFKDHRLHADLDYQNFLCSFNASPHVGRKLLLSALRRFGWYDPISVSKLFEIDLVELDGHLRDYLDELQHSMYRRFFIDCDDHEFYRACNTIGQFDLCDIEQRHHHTKNIPQIETTIAQSFLHLVSESVSTSYYPFVTEKYLYSIVSRGIFVAYAQPGWHRYINQLYGFRMYDRLFDYGFDDIANPVVRLIELLSMIFKFSVLKKHDWHDLYLLEQETIEYNYDRFFSQDYLKTLQGLHEQN